MTLPGSYARWPSVAISAGSRVTAARTATPTTTIAPIAIECAVLELIRNRPARAMITVTPEKATARPEVRIATVRASSSDAPALISSR